MAFVDSHASEVAAAVLAAPEFLSGLSPTELGVVKQRIAARADPELARSKAEATRALAGWRSAIRQISDRGGLGEGHNGAAAGPVSADTGPAAAQGLCLLQVPERRATLVALLSLPCAGPFSQRANKTAGPTAPSSVSVVQFV